MIFGRKKISAIDRRLDELQREMAKVGTEIKTLARYKKTVDAVSALKAGKARFAGSKSAPAMGKEAAAEFSSADGKNRSSGPDDLFPGEQENGKTNSAFAADAVGRGDGDLPLFENRSPISTTSRERFANYFTAGHFPNLRPLRQEKRIIQNKAIVMIVLVVLALIWLLFSLHN